MIESIQNDFEGNIFDFNFTAVTTMKNKNNYSLMSRPTTWKNFTDKFLSPPEIDLSGHYDSAGNIDKNWQKDINGAFIVGKANKNTGKRVCEFTNAIVLDIEISSDMIAEHPEFTSKFIKDKIADTISKYAYLLYTTRKHSLDSPRYRLIIPVLENLDKSHLSEYTLIMIAKIFGSFDYVDTTCRQENRIFYFPSPIKGETAKYECIIHNGHDVLTSSEIEDMKSELSFELKELINNFDGQKPNTAYVNHSVRGKDTSCDASPIKNLPNPKLKKGIVGDFCTAFPIEKAISVFLPDIYEKCSNGKYKFIGSDSPAGGIVYDNGNYFFSNHKSDPAYGKCLNSYDLVRIHKFGNLDESYKGYNPAYAPSGKAMFAFAKDISEVRLINKQRFYGELYGNR